MTDLETFVRKGQRYETVFDAFEPHDRLNICTRPPVWEVQSVSTRFRSIPPIPHARIVNAEDPCDIRLVSCAAIADERCFRLVEQTEAQPVPEAEAA